MVIKQIEISVSHEIKIDGESSWVKLGAQAELMPGDDYDDCVNDLSIKVNEKIIDVIKNTVSVVSGQ